MGNTSREGCYKLVSEHDFGTQKMFSKTKWSNQSNTEMKYPSATLTTLAVDHCKLSFHLYLLSFMKLMCSFSGPMSHTPVDPSQRGQNEGAAPQVP